MEVNRGIKECVNKCVLNRAKKRERERKKKGEKGN